MPLLKLLEGLPQFPSAQDINFTSVAAHLQLYDSLVEAGRMHNALELLRALKKAGLHGVGWKVSNKVFLRQCARRNAVAVAFEFVAFIDYPDVRLYNMLLSVCAAACDSRSGFAAFVLMCDAGVSPDCRAYTTLISACAKSGDLEKAFETFRRMVEDGVEPTVVTYGAVMDALSRRVLEMTSGVGVKASPTAAAAAAAEEVGSLLTRCFELRNEMRDRGVVPDECVLNSLVIACGRAAVLKPLAADALEKAFGVFSDMERSHSRLSCDAYTYASLIKACVNAGDSRRGLQLYAQMGNARPPVKRTAPVFGAAIHACASNAVTDLPRALEIWEDMRRERVAPDAMLFATLMDVAGRAGERGVAAQVLSEMEREGIAPTEEVFSTMAGIAARDGDIVGVESVLQEMGARGAPPPLSAFNALIAAHARQGDVEAAEEVAVRLQAAGLAADVKTYEGLVSAAAAASQPSLAWSYYDEAVKRRIDPTLPMFNSLVIASGRGGKLALTFEAVDAMRKAGYAPDEVTWRELLSSCARHGNALLAWETYKQSRQAGNAPSEVALNIIIGVTLLHIRELTDPDRLGAMDEDPDTGMPTYGIRAAAAEPAWKEWADRAIAVYHEATVAGVRPRLGTFSAMLACLRPPTLPALQAADREGGGALARAVSHEVSSHEDARKYYPLRALIMFEEAQALGVVPKFDAEEDSDYDIRQFPPAAAEVAVLTLLRVFRRYSDSHAGNGEVELPNVTLRVLTDEEHALLIASPDATSQRLARTGERVIVLLRRLRFNYGGSLQEGRIEMSGHIIRRWLMAKPPPLEAMPGSEPRLAGSITDQARNIRSRSWTSDWGEPNVSAPWANRGSSGSFGSGSGGGGGDPRGGRAGAGGTGQRSDFMGAADKRYNGAAGGGADGDDDDDYDAVYNGAYPKNWVKAGWSLDEDEDEGMMGDLNRIIAGRK